MQNNLPPNSVACQSCKMTGMLSPLPYILIQHAYFFGANTNTSTGCPNSIPSINESSSQTTPAPGHNESRRDDYTYVPGLSGYKLHTRALVWNDARLMCEQEGGYLAIINSVDESNAIAQLFLDSEPIIDTDYQGVAFIGYHDLFHEGEYLTIHGESLQNAGFAKWDIGQPNFSNEQDCGGVNSNGLLNDLWCATTFGFICEIPPA